jgi:hypothetical protein
MSVRLLLWGDPPLPRAILKRLHNSTLAWSWVSNVLRLAKETLAALWKFRARTRNLSLWGGLPLLAFG